MHFLFNQLTTETFMIDFLAGWVVFIVMRCLRQIFLSLAPIGI